MCHLVTDSSVIVQKMAYHMLHEAAAKRTEHIVVEAAMDSEVNSSPELPIELVLLLQQGMLQEDETEVNPVRKCGNHRSKSNPHVRMCLDICSGGC